MMTHAYDEEYLEEAKDTLGTALEFAILNCHIKGQEFLQFFIISGIASEFSKGNIKYISGMSGIELALKVLNKCGINPDCDYNLDRIDYSPEYWCGSMIAHYQWYSGKDFSTILKQLPYEKIRNLYILHEADEQKALTSFDSITNQPTETNLARIRKQRGLSQSQLARKSNVTLRSIQLYEQRQNDISKAQYNRLAAIAQALQTDISALI